MWIMVIFSFFSSTFSRSLIAISNHSKLCFSFMIIFSILFYSWAFSATEEIESMDFLEKHSGAKPKQLSVQQIVDCDEKAYGCKKQHFLMSKRR